MGEKVRECPPTFARPNHETPLGGGTNPQRIEVGDVLHSLGPWSLTRDVEEIKRRLLGPPGTLVRSPFPTLSPHSPWTSSLPHPLPHPPSPTPVPLVHGCNPSRC